MVTIKVHSMGTSAVPGQPDIVPKSTLRLPSPAGPLPRRWITWTTTPGEFGFGGYKDKSNPAIL